MALTGERAITHTPVVILDCQTSGMADAEVIELGWQRYSAASPDEAIHSQLVAMQDPEALPSRVTKLTGITATDLADAPPRADAIAALKRGALSSPAVIVIHYAAFERRFLADLLAEPAVLDVVCTHKLAAKLWPNLPSKSLRSVSGYLGMPVAKLKRSADHIAATAVIWQAALGILAKAGHHSWGELQAVISGQLKITPAEQSPAAKNTGAKSAATKSAAAGKAYRLPRALRLGLPQTPGVYHLLAADGGLLYVGKAVNLHARVNSYFRGQKTKGSRLNELVSQVNDVRTFGAGSGLEAELLEQEHIAAYRPPYNVALVENHAKPIAFIDQRLQPTEPDALGSFGPFTATDTIAMLATICGAGFRPEDVPQPLLALAARRGASLEALFMGLGLFRAQLAGDSSLRTLALSHWRASLVAANTERDEDPEENPAPWQADDICGFLNRRLAGLVRRSHRGRWLKRLRCADLWWTEGERCHAAAFRGSRASFGAATAILPATSHRPPAAIATRHDYDRATIVLAFIKERLSQKPDEGLWLRCYPGKLLSARQLARLLPGEVAR